MKQVNIFKKYDPIQLLSQKHIFINQKKFANQVKSYLSQSNLITKSSRKKPFYKTSSVGLQIYKIKSQNGKKQGSDLSPQIQIKKRSIFLIQQIIYIYKQKKLIRISLKKLRIKKLLLELIENKPLLKQCLFRKHQILIRDLKRYSFSFRENLTQILNQLKMKKAQNLNIYFDQQLQKQLLYVANKLGEQINKNIDYNLKHKQINIKTFRQNIFKFRQRPINVRLSYPLHFTNFSENLKIIETKFGKLSYISGTSRNFFSNLEKTYNNLNFD